MKHLLVLCTSIFLIGCAAEVVTPIEMGYEYQKLKIGEYRIYEVDSITVDDFFDPPQIDTVSYLVREEVTDTFYDNEQRLSYRLERSKKFKQDTLSYDSIAWTLKDVWYATLTNRRYEKVEENVRFVRLNFPIEPGRTWDGNALNTEESWEYEYIDVDVPLTIGALSFDSTCYVLHANDTNLIERRFAYEIYGKNVGLIKKELKDVRYKFPEGIMESGVIFDQTLIEYYIP